MRRTPGTILVTILLGILLGAIFSELIGLFLREGSVIEKILHSGQEIGFEARDWNLAFLKFTFGLRIHCNLMTVVGVFIGLQILRWYR
jgi:hypothetical protein